MKAKCVLIILVVTFVLSSCAIADNNLAVEPTSPILTELATTFAQPTSTPTPQSPKYIFIVIGDGFGRGAMTLGEIYARLNNEDMTKGAQWENFTYQSYVEGMSESASGGTAIASGVETEPWYIGADADGNRLYTIMDRAKEAGMSTGVVTNSYIVDATPASFLSHTLSRYEYDDIALGFAKSNVDYIAGGGLKYILPDDNAFAQKPDAMHSISKFEGPAEAIPQLVDMGYETNFGLEAALRMLDSIDNNNFTAQKSINIYTESKAPYDYYRYKAANTLEYDSLPTLVDMTEAGIQSLGQNENGFVMMIEAALIDKSEHKASQEMAIYQVVVLNRLLEHLMKFYNEHPDDTLIILSADHETGDFEYNDDLLNNWKASNDFVWMNNGKEMAMYANEQWGVKLDGASLQNKIDIAQLESFANIDEDRQSIFATVTVGVSLEYGTQIRTGSHSEQEVPLFVIGSHSYQFEGSTHIKQIPIVICTVMEWEALPELLTEIN